LVKIFIDQNHRFVEYKRGFFAQSAFFAQLLVFVALVALHPQATQY
jgi:hypothetical protein